MEGIDIQIYKVGALQDIALFKAFGYIDTNTSPALQKTIVQTIEEGVSQFLIDLGSVQYVSSAGWGVFVGEIRSLREKGGDLKISQMSPEVYEVFEMLEFNRILAHYETNEEAIEDYDFYRDVHAIPSQPVERVKIAVPPPDSDTIAEPRVLEEPAIAVAERVEAEAGSISRPSIQEFDSQPQALQDDATNGNTNNWMPNPQYRKAAPASRRVTDVDPSNLPLTEKIKKVIMENPVASIFAIHKELNSARYGFSKLSIFALQKNLKTLDLDSKAKRYRYYRSR